MSGRDRRVRSVLTVVLVPVMLLGAMEGARQVGLVSVRRHVHLFLAHLGLASVAVAILSTRVMPDRGTSVRGRILRASLLAGSSFGMVVLVQCVALANTTYFAAMLRGDALDRAARTAKAAVEFLIQSPRPLVGFAVVALPPAVHLGVVAVGGRTTQLLWLVPCVILAFRPLVDTYSMSFRVFDLGGKGAASMDVAFAIAALNSLGLEIASRVTRHEGSCVLAHRRDDARHEPEGDPT